MMINPSVARRAVRSQSSSRSTRLCSGRALCSLVLLGVMALSLVGCGLLLGDPPTYPDQGAGGEDMVSERQDPAQDDMSVSGGPGSDEQSSLDQMSDGE